MGPQPKKILVLTDDYEGIRNRVEKIDPDILVTSDAKGYTVITRGEMLEVGVNNTSTLIITISVDGISYHREKLLTQEKQDEMRWFGDIKDAETDAEKRSGQYTDFAYVVVTSDSQSPSGKKFGSMTMTLAMATIPDRQCWSTFVDGGRHIH